jgi:hypothetical protein
MTRIFLLASLLSTTIFAQRFEVELPTNPIIKGSLVCGDKVMRIANLPANLKMLRLVGKEIISDPIAKTISIKYSFDYDTIAVREVDTTILNDYLPNKLESLLIRPGTTWQLIESFAVGSVAVGPTVTNTIYPYANCFEYSYTCSNVKVKRKRLRKICSSVAVRTKYNKVVQNDTLRAIFRDSTFLQGAVCLAIGYTIVSDSIMFEKLDNIDYKLRVAETNWQDVVCITACPSPIEVPVTSKFLGNVYLSKCIPTGFENEMSLEHQVLIYPNPANKSVYINDAEGDLILSDKLGKETAVSGNGHYSLSGILPGLYFATFESKGKRFTQKLVVE